MSVIIKGMDMPTGCYTCPIIYSEDGVFDFECPFNSYLLWHDAEDVIRYRPDSCPLVGAPTPHGRLIDENELLRHKYGFSQTVRTIIKNTDAVIEAEASE